MIGSRMKQGWGTGQPVAAVAWLGDVHRLNHGQVAPEYRQLSDLLLAGLPVLPGFVVAADFYRAYLQQTKTDRFLTRALLNIDWSSSRSIHAASKAVVKHLESTPIPGPLMESVAEAFQRLQQQADGTVILSSSVSDETLPIQSTVELAKALIRTYAHLFDARYLDRESVDGLSNGQIVPSCLVQPLVDVTHSGRLALVDGFMVIEAIHGRPEPLLENLLTPDRYQVDPATLAVIHTDINRQDWQLSRLDRSGKHQKVSSLERGGQKVDDETVTELAKLGLMLRHQTDLSQRLIWILDSHSKTWVVGVQSLGVLREQAAEYSVPTQEPIAYGRPVVIGRAVGSVRRLHHPSDTSRVQPGDIAVVESGDQVSTHLIGQIAGIIIETAAVPTELSEVAIEQGCPLVSAAKNAHQLTDGLLITLDATTGAIYRGKPMTLPSRTAMPARPQLTGVKLYQIPANPYELAGDPSQGDGIGYLSAKLLLARDGIHPRKQFRQSTKALLGLLVDELCSVAQAWGSQPVMYAAHDWLTSDYRSLDGGPDHEPAEAMPALGYRGAHRALRELDLFKMELEAIRQVREEYNHPTIDLILPFVRTQKELTALQHAIIGSGLKPGYHFRVWLLAQTPANLTMLKKIVPKHLIQGVCLELDSLTQLLLGADPHNEELQGEYDVCDENVQDVLAEAIAAARKAGLPVTAIGRSLDHHPEAIEALVAAGITGLVVESHAIASTAQLVASAEQRVLLDRAVATLRRS